MCFLAGKNEVTFTVTICDEGLIEEFYIDLEIQASSANLSVIKDSPESATVIVTDDDSECCSMQCTTMNTTRTF